MPQFFLSITFISVVASLTFAESHVAPIDLLKHDPADKLHIKKIGDETYEWSLPEGQPERMRLNLPAMGIDPSKFDEFRFDIMPLGSQVRMQTMILGLPDEDQLSSWYLKFKTEVGHWAQGRYDLRLDDDGIFHRGRKFTDPSGTMILDLGRRMLGKIGEPKWRKARLRNPRFVRHLISADFDMRDTEFVEEGDELTYIYQLHVENLTDRTQAIKIEPDPDDSMHYFAIDAAAEVTLSANEEKVIPIKISISRVKALSLPPLFSEPIRPRVSIPGIEDSNVTPLLGFRPKVMWGVVPVFNRNVWTPQTMQAFLDAREKAMPSIASWKQRTIRYADNAMKYDWPMPENILPGHTMSYRSPKGNCWLKPVDPTNFHKHICPVTKEVFENHAGYDAAYVGRYYGARSNDIRHLALAWLFTGNKQYADKAFKMLTSFAKAHPKMPIAGIRSTSGASRLGCNTLLGSYNLPAMSEGYHFLHGYRGPDQKQRELIETFLLDEALRVGRHSTEFSNQTAEHIRGSASAALAIGFWPLAAEKIFGEFGFHEMVEYAFSEDGIGHEAGAYHHSIFHAMNEFGAFAHESGINLYTPRFKRVFDGSLIAGLSSTSYEMAFRVYRESAWLKRLASQRKSVNEMAALHGVLGIPAAADIPVQSAHMQGAGYIYLRKGNASESMEIRMNYIKTFDRTERDKMSTSFFRNGQMIDHTTGRIAYTSPRTHWMYETAAHSTIVIDGGKSNINADGYVVAYEPVTKTPIAVVATRPDAPFFQGVQQLRGIALIDDSYIVFDRVTCDTPRTIDRYQHGRGKATLRFKTEPVGELANAPEEGEFTDIVGGPCGKQVVVEFENDLKMRAVTDSDVSGYKATTISGWQGSDPREIFILRGNQLKSLTCLAAFSFGKDANPPKVEIVKSDAAEAKFKITGKSSAYLIRVDIKGGAAEVIEVVD